ncbi:MAG: PQQ-dependent sugar dehydrogenase [Actinomycetota bacterium]
MLRAAVVACIALIATACGDNGADSRRVVASPADTSSADASVSLASPRATPSRTASTPRPATPAPAASPAEFAEAEVKFTKVVDVTEPIALSQRPNSSTIYVAEKGGQVKAVQGGEIVGTVLNISSEVSNSGEQGFLGLAFNPRGDRFYVYFTQRSSGRQIVREYTFSNGRGTAPRNLLVMDDQYPNHNGGNLLFGPDGYLYISTGDGGGSGDPQGNGQNINSLLGKILRIDPRSSGRDSYRSPPDNPFVGRDGRDEVWAFGLRNPWRFSFDRANGDLWIGDVGQFIWEEIDRQKGGIDGGQNYGWNLREGNHQFRGAPPPNHVGPVHEYNHDDGNCSVTGGYVYRGSRIRDLSGAYLFADYCVGRLQGFVYEDGEARGHRFLGPQVDQLTSFGQDHEGNLYVMSLGGGLYRIDPA